MLEVSQRSPPQGEGAPFPAPSPGRQLTEAGEELVGGCEESPRALSYERVHICPDEERSARAPPLTSWIQSAGAGVENTQELSKKALTLHEILRRMVLKLTACVSPSSTGKRSSFPGKESQNEQHRYVGPRGFVNCVREGSSRTWAPVAHGRDTSRRNNVQAARPAQPLATFDLEGRMAEDKAGLRNAPAEATPGPGSPKRPERIRLAVGAHVGGSIRLTVEKNSKPRIGSKVRYVATAVCGVLLGVALTLTAYHATAHGMQNIVKEILDVAREAIKLLGG